MQGKKLSETYKNAFGETIPDRDRPPEAVVFSVLIEIVRRQETGMFAKKN